MYSRRANSGNITGATPFVVPTTAPVAPSNHQNGHESAPGRSAAPTQTRDFYLDTFFNPVWMSGPNVFSFSENGTVVRPKTYAPEPYPGYHADGARRVEGANASQFRKPWKNVAITEQDDAEFEAFQERMRRGAVGEFGRNPQYGGLCEPSSKPQEPELVYTWPPRPRAW